MTDLDSVLARPSFVEAVARALAISDMHQGHENALSPEQEDAWALYEDFRAVGQDIGRAMGALPLAE